MEVTYLESAALVIEDDSTKLLCDPWLLDGAYFGSWAHYPPPDFEPEDFNDVDYIYISHVHPDHFHPETLERMDTDIPVLIHDYRWDYLREKIETLGFDVIELPHNERVHLDGDMHINVLAADGCEPQRCGNFFGCTWYDDEAEKTGSTQVDSMAVIDNGEFTVVNTNDCPYPMAEPSCRTIQEEYGDIDLLAHQYSAAQFYPQAVTNYSHEKKIEERDRVIREKQELALNFIDLFEPDFYLPFAGEYVLTGSLSDLNQYTANPPRKEVLEFFRDNVDPDEHQCVVLNTGESLDLASGEQSAEFEPPDPAEKQRYIDEVLAERTFTYEREPMPSLEELKAYIPYAYESLEAKRETIGYETDTTVLVPLRDDVTAAISMNGEGYEFVEDPDVSAFDGFVEFDTDPRLLKWLLESPERAYWADAKIGSHIGIRKEPDIYERGLYNCMSAFHAGDHDVDPPSTSEQASA